MAEKRTIELEIQDNSKSLKAQYREAVQELQKLSATYGETSEQAVKAARAAAELKDQIEFSKDLIKGFNPDAKFQAVEGAVNGVMNGFQAFTGGMALLGVESDKVEEALLKVQSVMALTQGINGVMQAGDAFKVLGASAKTALSGIRTGIAATGIGLFVVALGTVVAYWDDIKAAVSGVSDEQKKLNKESAKNAATAKETYESFELQENSLRLQGKTEKQILKLKIDKLDASIKTTEADIARLEKTSKLEIAAAERNQEFAKSIIRLGLEGSVALMRALVLPLDAVILAANSVAEVLGITSIQVPYINGLLTDLTTAGADFLSGLLFDPEAVKAESDATIKEAKRGLAQMKSDRQGFELQLKQDDQQNTQDRVNTESGAAQEQIDITRQMEEEQNRLMQEGRAKDLDALRIKYKYEQEEADKNFKEGKLKKADYDKLTNQMTESKRLDDKAVNDKYDKIEKDARDLKLKEQIKAQDEQWYALQKIKNSQKEQELLDLQIAYDKEYEAALNNTELQKELTRKFNKDSAAINEKYRKEEAAKEIEAAKAVREQKQAIQNQGIELALEGVQLIKNVFEKSKGVQKAAVIAESAIGIAKMIISNKLANAGALATPQAIATSGAAAAPVIAMNNISTGIGIAANIAATAKALKSLGGGSAPNAPAGSGGGGGVAAPMTANFNTIGSSGINQLAQLQQTPTQAYVVSGEVTSAQALDRNRVQNATL